MRGCNHDGRRVKGLSGNFKIALPFIGSFNEVIPVLKQCHMTLQILNFGRPVMIQAGLDELDQARQDFSIGTLPKCTFF